MTDIQRIVREAWPDWELTAEIGQGSFSRVYRAKSKDGMEAAIKAQMIPDDWEDPEVLTSEGYTQEQVQTYYEQRVRDYTKEITIMRTLQDAAGIVKIEDHCVLHPEPLRWIILIRMELLENLTKKAMINGMDEKQLAQVGLDLCGALSQCHRRNIVHRDIKPENVFVDPDGHCKLGDFGAANEMNRTGTLSWKGTPNFMAPEVYRAETGGRELRRFILADIYSVGMVLYWLGNGLSLPFVHAGKQIASPQERSQAFQRRIGGERLPPPSQVTAPLADVILRACAYLPEERWQSAEEMAEALKTAASEGNTLAVQKKRRKLLVCLIAVLLLGTAALTWRLLSSPNTTHVTPTSGANPVPSETPIATEMPSATETAASSREPEKHSAGFPKKDVINMYIYFSESAWTGEAQAALWSAMEATPYNEKWIASSEYDVPNNPPDVVDTFFERVRCETMGLWDISVNPWDPEQWPVAEAVLFFPRQNVDFSPLIEELTAAGIPAYVFSSDDPEAVYNEYLVLYE